jgi:SAM-dependent methyltransferase
MNYVRLATRGRKTGLPHIVEVRYAWIDGSFYVIAGRKNNDWVLNLLHTRVGIARLADLLFESSVQIAKEKERMAAIDEYVRKYGRRLVEQWYGDSPTCLRLTPLGPPTKRGAPAGEFDSKTTLDDWKKSRVDYYADVAAAFDSASEEYDFTISRNFINTWIRQRSIEVLRRYARPDDVALEIGCGTGAEALQVAKFVRRLVAIDVSQNMIDLLSAKVNARGLVGKIVPVRLAAAEVSKVRGVLGGPRVRLAYSFNGALNCEPRITDFVEALSVLLEPGGILVCSVRNTLCLSEVVSHATALQFDRANPRKHQPVMVSVGGKDIPSTYYSPGAFLKLFRPEFTPREVIALPGLLPPAYLNDYYLKLRNITAVFERLEALLSNRFPLNRFGDQTLFVLEKSDSLPS